MPFCLNGRLLIWIAAALIVLASGFHGAAQLALTPPRGWNSWNHFHRTIDDAIVRQSAAVTTP